MTEAYTPARLLCVVSVLMSSAPCAFVRAANTLISTSHKKTGHVGCGGVVVVVVSGGGDV